MRAYEILLELEATARVKHGKYLLVHTIEPTANNNYLGYVYDADNTIIGKLSNSDLDILKTDFVDLAVTDERTALKGKLEKREKVSANEVQKAALNFNTAFTTKIFQNEMPTAIRLGIDSGKLIIDVMTRDYFDIGGIDVDKSFRKVKDREWNKKARTKIYGLGNVNPAKLEQMGFEFHGVYDLTDEKSPEAEEFARYSLELIAYSNKQQSYTFPTITIAFWYKKDGSYSGDVQ